MNETELRIKFHEEEANRLLNMNVLVQEFWRHIQQCESLRQQRDEPSSQQQEQQDQT